MSLFRLQDYPPVLADWRAAVPTMASPSPVLLRLLNQSMTKKLLLPEEANLEKPAAPQEFVKAIVAPGHLRYLAAAPLHSACAQSRSLCVKDSFERRPGAAELWPRDPFSHHSSRPSVHGVRGCPGTTEPPFARPLLPSPLVPPANRDRPGAGKRCTHRLAYRESRRAPPSCSGQSHCSARPSEYSHTGQAPSATASSACSRTPSRHGPSYPLGTLPTPFDTPHPRPSNGFPSDGGRLHLSPR